MGGFFEIEHFKGLRGIADYIRRCCALRSLRRTRFLSLNPALRQKSCHSTQ